MSIDADRLRRLLGGPELTWLMDRLQRRLRSGKVLRGSVCLSSATPDQRYAVGRLFGRPISSAESVTVSLDELDATLRDAGLCASLREAVESIYGPVENIRARREEDRRLWSISFDEIGQDRRAHAAVCAWLEALRRNGLLRRLAANDPSLGKVFLTQALAVIDRLPSKGISLAELAATTLGDSHALDPGRPVATLVLASAPHLGGLAPISDADSRRAAWESLGVVCDQISAPVLVLNLHSSNDTLTGRALNDHAEAGEPYRLTARQLIRHPPHWACERFGNRVFVCENPTVVVAAAERLGKGCAPLVCLDGLPCAAARHLLQSLSDSGCSLHYHGDFDWGGVRIGNFVMRRYRAVPWRFSARNYDQALHGRGLRLTGRKTIAIWDEKLADAMSSAGVAIHEEQLIDEILSDLGD